MTAAPTHDHFDEIWAVDWSGARGRYAGIAVARLAAGDDRVEIVPPPAGGRWTRSAVVDRLAREIGSGKRLLMGFDFAFSLPVAALRRLGLGRARVMSEIWAAVDDVCAADGDFHAGRFIAAAPPGVFWERGSRPADWNGGLRRVDEVCRAATGVRPESVLKLIGPKQVGRAALAGMRALRALVAAGDGRVVCWPQEPATAPHSVAVEIFPTIYRYRALGSMRKIRHEAVLDRALAGFGLRALDGGGAALSDDVADAVIAAAGLRQLGARDAALGMPAEPLSRLEGWIVGVPP